MIKTKQLIKTSIFFFVLVVFSIFTFQISLASITNGTIDDTYKYAYSENTGWINFKDTNSNIVITDTVLTGYAYSENTGWISLNCSNTDTCSNNNYKVSNTSNGVLSGYAYGENTGWINFSGVSINSSGEFTGYAYGENIGYISFNCSNDDRCEENDYKVKTDWRPASTRPQCNNGIDDDNDGYTDYPSDTGCTSLTDDNETNPSSGGGYIPSFTPINNSNINNNTEPSNTISDTTSWTTGRWVKTSDSPVVYFVDTNNVRHAYSNESIWKSYFNNDFSFVSTISKEELANYQLDRNVPFNINTLFKIPSIPKVYRVGNNRSISWIKTEELANKLYANNWNKLVKDLSDSLFGDYILEEDTDNDGLNDSDEEIYKTDKNNNDTDGDTYLDGEEVIHKYDPLKAANDKL